MTEEAARAKHLFDGGRWEQASLLLKRVSDGETGDDETNRELAQYRIAIALFNLKYLQMSYAIFSDIAAKSKHVKHSESLLWLARLALLMPFIDAHVTEGLVTMEKVRVVGYRHRIGEAVQHPA